MSIHSGTNKKDRHTVANNFNVFAIVQGGRLQYEAIAFAATFRHKHPHFKGRLIFGEPQYTDNWDYDPRIDSMDVRETLKSFGAEIIPFENRIFGSDYPYGNKIVGLTCLPKNEPFIFFDTDTIFTGRLNAIDFDFNRPSASMKRTNTWPEIDLYGPGYTETWKSLYDQFGLDFEGSLDLSHPDEYWQRYMYFNAGWFFYKCPHDFADLFLHYATEILREPNYEVCTQEFNPWLDQVALPLVISKLGGGRPTESQLMLDGEVACHYRALPLLYAKESDEAVEALEAAVSPNKIKKIMKQSEAYRKIVYQSKGEKIRSMFDRENLPRKEQAIRQRLKKRNMWLR
jgi:hypothetical protein